MLQEAAVRPLHSTIRNSPSITAFLAVCTVFGWTAPLGGCSTSSSPTKPGPQADQGRVELTLNDSYFSAQVAAGFDCRDEQVMEPEDDDFSPVHIDLELSCSSFAQGEMHAAHLEVLTAMTFRHDGPDDTLSEIRFAAATTGNHSRTGLASTATHMRMRLRFEVTGEPVAYRAIGALTYEDSFYDWIDLRVVGASNGDEILHEGGQGHGVEGSLTFDRTGTLPVGSYEVRVDLTTTDWFTEVVEFSLVFSAPESR